MGLSQQLGREVQVSNFDLGFGLVGSRDCEEMRGSQ